MIFLWLKYVSIFGDANVNYVDDWREVLLNTDAIGEPGVFDIDERKCTLATSVNI